MTSLFEKLPVASTVPLIMAVSPNPQLGLLSPSHVTVKSKLENGSPSHTAVFTVKLMAEAEGVDSDDARREIAEIDFILICFDLI